MSSHYAGGGNVSTADPPHVNVLPEVTPPPDREAVATLRALVHATENLRAAVATRLGVGTTDVVAMYHLATAGPMTATALARRLGITSGSVTVLADRLTAAGFARRKTRSTDRRSVSLVLTPAGSSAIEDAERALLAAISELGVSGITPALLTLDKLTEAVDRQTELYRSAGTPLAR